MKIKIGILLIFISFSFQLISQQFSVTMASSKVYTCKDTVITFTAVATNGGVPVTDATFTWSFGDNTAPVSGLMLDTVNHSFTGKGGFIVRVDAVRGANSDYVLKEIQIGVEPSFKGTNLDLSDSICLGQEIFLTGKTSTKVWKYKIPNTRTETNPALVDNTNPYTGKIDYRIFDKTRTILDVLNIDTVGINIEHSDIRNLKIELKCPNGTSITLKDFGGFDKGFGIPVNDEGSNLPGTGYNYYWTNTPDYVTMNLVNPTQESLPSGEYTPEEPFNNLVGCPLNGEWQIIVTDNQPQDNGFVFSAELKFDDAILPPTWQYNNTYTYPEWKGSGVSTTTGTGDATATPDVHGNHKYTFRVKDNYGCSQDTALYKFVEPVTFTTNPDSAKGDFDLIIEFTNTTSWATEFAWDFRDNSPFETVSPITHTFTKAGKFWAKLTASTNDGCSDTASILVVVTTPKMVFDQMPNVFTPNGKNPVFCLNEGSLKGIQSLDCFIYSRWGKKVAEWHSVEDAIKGWDGNVKDGPKASAGVYYYYIKVVGFDGQVYEKKSFFHLFR